MATRLLSEGDTISMTGEVTRVHTDGTVTVRLLGYSVPFALLVKRKEPGRRKQLFDKPD